MNENDHDGYMYLWTDAGVEALQGVTHGVGAGGRVRGAGAVAVHQGRHQGGGGVGGASLTGPPVTRLPCG